MPRSSDSLKEPRRLRIDDACEDLDLDVGSRFLLAIPKCIPSLVAALSILISLATFVLKLWLGAWAMKRLQKWPLLEVTS